MTCGHSFRYGSMRAIAPGRRAWLHGRMGFRKTYVDVVANIDVDGRVTPLSIRWRDGRTFEIDRVHEAIRRASTRVGGTGIRYLVTVHGRDKYLFFEDPRWFVEEVVPDEAEAPRLAGEFRSLPVQQRLVFYCPGDSLLVLAAGSSLPRQPPRSCPAFPCIQGGMRLSAVVDGKGRVSAALSLTRLAVLH